MDFTADKSHAEQALDWIAALALGAAGGFAAFATMPVAPVAMSAVVALAMTLAGLAVMQRFDGQMAAEFAFNFVPWADAMKEEEPLELVDRIAPAAADSRVFQLFAPETVAAPGELAARIEDWLDGARQRIGESGERPLAATPGHGPASSPASTALHAALADIRRSLR